jgi:nucleotide-binding universal stress UspA family protein
MRYAKILCPVDFSDVSHEALVAAADIARSNDALLEIVHIFELSLFAFPQITIRPDIAEEMINKGRANLARWAKEAEGLGVRRVESSQPEGVPWDAIIRLARDHQADLVVMGTHGRTGVRHALIGSVAERVVRHAPCPVLVVRPLERGRNADTNAR